MAKYKKGQSGNPAGRPRGSKNKITSDVRTAIGLFLSKNFGSVQEIFDELKPSEKLKFITDLLPYHVARLSSTELRTDLERLSQDEIESIVNEIIDKIK